MKHHFMSFRVCSARVYVSCVRAAQVPEEEVKLEEELVRCVMVLLNKPHGLLTLEASSNLLPILAVRKSPPPTWSKYVG